MSLSDRHPARRRLLPSLLMALGFLALPVLAGCSMAPVYGNVAATESNLRLNFSRPAGRLDQIIYHALELRLPRPERDSPQLTVVTRASTRYPVKSANPDPMLPLQVTVTAQIRVIDKDGKVLFDGQRSATASYQESRQVLANVSADSEAAERAARELAETIRLTLIAALTGPNAR